MAAQMPLSLLYEWMAFAAMSPLLFDERYAQSRQDWNAAMVATTLRNALVGLWVKNPQLMKLGELMYDDERERARQKQQSPREIYAAMKMAVLLHSGWKADDDA